MSIFKLPNFNTKILFKKEIGRQVFDFIITITAFGEVLAVENHFLLLPENAQRLSTDYKNIKKIKTVETSLKFHIPLIAIKRHKFQQFHEIYSAIKDLRKNLEKHLLSKNESSDLEIKMRKLFACNSEFDESDEVFLKANIRDDWTFELWKLFKRNPQHEDFEHLTNLLSDDDNKIKKTLSYKATQNISTPLIISVLLNSYSIFEQKLGYYEKKAMYRLLFKFPNLSVLPFLLNHLNESSNNSHFTLIIATLGKFNNQTIKEALVKFYFNNIAINSDNLGSLAIALKFYNNDPIVKSILVEMLYGEGYYVLQSAKVLKYNFEMGNEELAKIAHSIIKKRESIQQINITLRVLIEVVKEVKYLPNIEEILEVFFWSVNKDADKALVWATGGVISKILSVNRKKLDDKISSRLIHLIKYSSNEMKTAVLKLFKKIGNREHLQFLVELVFTNENDIKNKVLTLEVIRSILFNYPTLDILPNLLKLLNSESSRIKRVSLEALSNIVKRFPDNRVIEPVTKLLIDETEAVSVREMAAAILSKFKTTEILKLFEVMQNDKNLEVRRIIQLSLKKMQSPKQDNNQVIEMMKLFIEQMKKREQIFKK